MLFSWSPTIRVLRAMAEWTPGSRVVRLGGEEQPWGIRQVESGVTRSGTNSIGRSIFLQNGFLGGARAPRPKRSNERLTAKAGRYGA